MFSKHFWYLCMVESMTDFNFVVFTVWHVTVIHFFKSVKDVDFCSYTLSFKYSHKKKYNGIRSGDNGGHLSGPFVPMLYIFPMHDRKKGKASTYLVPKC